MKKTGKPVTASTVLKVADIKKQDLTVKKGGSRGTVSHAQHIVPQIVAASMHQARAQVSGKTLPDAVLKSRIEHFPARSKGVAVGGGGALAHTGNPARTERHAPMTYPAHTTGAAHTTQPSIPVRDIKGPTNHSAMTRYSQT